MSSQKVSSDNQENSWYDSNASHSDSVLKHELKAEVGAGDTRDDHKVVNKSKPKITVKCSECEKTYSKSQYMLDHFRTVHLKSMANYSCRVCGRTSSWRVTILKHIKRSHPEKNTSKMIDILF